MIGFVSYIQKQYFASSTGKSYKVTKYTQTTSEVKELVNYSLAEKVLGLLSI